MKHETLMLQGLFAACLLVCALVLGTMLTTRVAPPPAAHALATSTSACVTTASTSTTAPCPLPRG